MKIGILVPVSENLNIRHLWLRIHWSWSPSNDVIRTRHGFSGAGFYLNATHPKWAQHYQMWANFSITPSHPPTKTKSSTRSEPPNWKGVFDHSRTSKSSFWWWSTFGKILHTSSNSTTTLISYSQDLTRQSIFGHSMVRPDSRFRLSRSLNSTSCLFVLFRADTEPWRFTWITSLNLNLVQPLPPSVIRPNPHGGKKPLRVSVAKQNHIGMDSSFLLLFKHTHTHTHRAEWQWRISGQWDPRRSSVWCHRTDHQSRKSITDPNIDRLWFVRSSIIYPPVSFSISTDHQHHQRHRRSVL